MAEGPIVPSRPIDYYYKMNHKNRGIALIFNHETFSDFDMPIRKGTHVDAIRLKQTFIDLGFEVRVYDNHTEAQIKSILQDGESLNSLTFFIHLKHTLCVVFLIKFHSIF